MAKPAAETITRTIPSANAARKTAKKKQQQKAKPAQPATLTADELLEYKVRMIMFATARDAYALWVRAIKAKYKIDQQSVLDIEAGTGKLYVRKQGREAVKANG